jgi:hypothetical protein
MTIKKVKTVEQELLEKELMHSGKYGHRINTSKKAYDRNKVKKELLKELDTNEYTDGI